MPQGKGTYGSKVGRPPKKKKYYGGGSVDPFSSKNPEGVIAKKEMEAIEEMNTQGNIQDAIPTANAQERSQTSPMGDEVGTGMYKKGGPVHRLQYPRTPGSMSMQQSKASLFEKAYPEVKSKKTNITDITDIVKDVEAIQPQFHRPTGTSNLRRKRIIKEKKKEILKGKKK